MDRRREAEGDGGGRWEVDVRRGGEEVALVGWSGGRAGSHGVSTSSHTAEIFADQGSGAMTTAGFTFGILAYSFAQPIQPPYLESRSCVGLILMVDTSIHVRSWAVAATCCPHRQILVAKRTRRGGPIE